MSADAHLNFLSVYSIGQVLGEVLGLLSTDGKFLIGPAKAVKAEGRGIQFGQVERIGNPYLVGRRRRCGFVLKGDGVRHCTHGLDVVRIFISTQGTYHLIGVIAVDGARFLLIAGSFQTVLAVPIGIQSTPTHIADGKQTLSHSSNTREIGATTQG